MFGSGRITGCRACAPPPGFFAATRRTRCAGRSGLRGLDLRFDRLHRLLELRDARFDVVVSNPPYVAEEERPALPPEVAVWEPSGALFAGPGGFAVIEPIITGAPAHLREGGLLALEIGAGQRAGVLERLEARGVYHKARLLRDMAGRDRVALAECFSLAPEEKRGDHA